MPDGGFRLEQESLGPNKMVIHNYGHGGGGITHSLGCADLVLDQVMAIEATGTKPVAVIGACVMGLTSGDESNQRNGSWVFS